ncbi:MAG TPA: RNA-binding protein [Candidatus Woesebacteria bacterium]|nr:RNA-binding protein [Candidatus Woesebacteria bacterium]
MIELKGIKREERDSWPEGITVDNCGLFISSNADYLKKRQVTRFLEDNWGQYGDKIATVIPSYGHNKFFIIRFVSPEPAQEILKDYRGHPDHYQLTDEKELYILPRYWRKLMKEEKEKGIDFHRLFLNHFEKNFRQDELYNLFGQFGGVLNTFLTHSKGDHQLIGFVLFTTTEAARKALDCLKQEPMGFEAVYARIKNPEKENLIIFKPGEKITSLPRVDLEEFLK